MNSNSELQLLDSSMQRFLNEFNVTDYPNNLNCQKKALIAIKREGCPLYVCSTMRLNDIRLLHAYLAEVIDRAKELGSDVVDAVWPKRQYLP